MSVQSLIRTARRLLGARPGRSSEPTPRKNGTERERDAVPVDGSAPAVEADGGTVRSESDDPGESEDATDVDGVDGDEAVVDGRGLLEAIDVPAFFLEADGQIGAWNDAVAAMTGVDADAAIGQTDAGELFYPDRDGEETLAELVLAAPEDATAEHGHIQRAEGSTGYAHQEWVCDVDDEDRYFDHRATPLYEDGGLVGIVQYSQERTTAMRRQEAVAHFVFELNQTISSLNDGDLEARVGFDGDREAVDDGLLAIEQHVNEMADQLQRHVERVGEATERIATASERAVVAAGDIEGNVADQNALLGKGVEEMQTFSATMEEVASTAEEVNAAATTAQEAATNGVEAGTDARAATREVIDIGDDLVESVDSLQDRMDDIEAVTEVISDVAEQTNMLALNANIEAARAGEEGEGFAVVADEVKALADETRDHTEEITDSIEQLRAQTDETVAAVTDSHDQIADASEQIETALSAFEEIDAAVGRVADGIAEVSDAIDDQATTVEDLTATLEDAREYAEGTETAADRVADATEEQADAVAELERRVRDLRS